LAMYGNKTLISNAALLMDYSNTNPNPNLNHDPYTNQTSR